ncbi:N-formylglutamate amidohydrolase [Aureimonas jatrophae]|uniref:Predicted N-formylglutamate amidohydrolase n=1 Tax=Aureimonas jatrophae TaxID=1166073 RepID=A0A1H0K179_9HYPH|nr:N-formylglutamate amidohydrolase [Aureimonas jatrophae]MBB3950901.1 putative N-formylglutamate amidohydrolase [Aureimonas jatrophae]SDO49717.1 Predicted N-formylglutamate amidohydrolase [Aureimonas jatrophae]
MTSLLQPGDPEPVGRLRPDAAGSIVLLGDHAGRAVPQSLGTLGLPDAELNRHIGWDIGIHGVSTRLSEALGAPYVFQRYSRLVIDCNRRPGHPQSIAPISDTTEVPGNLVVSDEARAAREREVFHPYQDAVAELLAARRARTLPTVVFAMHSCTDALRADGVHRPWEIGILADRDWRVGDALIEILREETAFTVGRNEPYVASALSDYTITTHAEGAGLPYAEIEIRQDLIATDGGQAEWAALCARLFPRAVARSGVLDG